METKERAIVVTTTPEVECSGAKIDKVKDMCKVLDYFRYKVGTSLDAAIDLQILRNSITWYIDTLEKAQLLQPVCRKADRNTGYLAKYYSADPTKWVAPVVNKQLSLFGEDEL